MQDLKGWAGLPLCAQLGCLQGGGERASPGEDKEGGEAGTPKGPRQGLLWWMPSYCHGH